MTNSEEAFSNLPIVDDTKESKEQKKKQSTDDSQQIDLLDINPEQISETDDGALKQENEDEFNPGDYAGFPMEAWNRYFGSINDKRQSRSADLAKRSAYTVRYNAAPPGSDYPNFKYTSLTYSFITKKAWEQRRRELAEIEDLERELQIQNTRLAETQESLRLRLFARNKPRGIITNRDDPNTAQLEEIQSNMKFLADFGSDIGKRIAEKKQASDLSAFMMYFHKGRDVYDQIMNEDLDDILRACDWKQIYGSSNLRVSTRSPTPGGSPGTS